LTSPFIDTEKLHGSGDTLSAAVFAILARVERLETADQRAHAFNAHAIHDAANWRLGSGHGPVNNFGP
jgi:hydroxymethylpyrimidine/phosphomethylpyrimidine kinase